MAVNSEQPTEPSDLLGEIVRLASTVNEVLADELGVSLRDLAALHRLVGRAPRGPADLARELGISTASATVLADRLERAGHLRRRADPSDRRRVVLEATPEMAERSARGVAPMARTLAALDAGRSAEQRAVLVDYLTDATSAIRHFLAQVDPPPSS